MHPTLERLRAYRVKADLSYEHLANRIAAATGRHFSASTLFHLCTDPEPRPQDRTLTKLGEFLRLTEEPHAKRRTPHRRRRTDR